jgi:hypothetical protein
MKRRITIFFSLVIFFLAVWWTMGQSRWHLDRNAYNDKPTGQLILVKDTLYRDTEDREWIRLPASMNALHQPKDTVAKPAPPYGNALSKLNFSYDPRASNLKFLCKTEDGGSMEAILQPNGNYLESGPLFGTYNYGHPEGLWGIIKHTVWDVLPHFANGNYRDPAE